MTVQDDLSPKTPVWSGDDLAQNPHCVEDKAQRVEAMFTAIARRYDLNNRLHSMWQDQIWRTRAVKAANLTGNEDVVDVACGTGDLAMAFYKANVKSVLGVDFTKAMLDLAVIKAQRAGLAIDYKQGDAMTLELQDASADVVSIAFGIRNVQDTKKAFAEFYRILRPNGRLVVLEFSTPKN
ncbi:MAG: ubiquinone/menaquinone biosynthesis methyltransferase, partial [Phycisphaerales bacterium]